MVRDTLDGAVGKLRGEIRREVDGFFSISGGACMGETMAFVRRYRPETERYREVLASAGFSSALYLVFQDFRQALEGYLAEVVTPELLNFLHRTETGMLTRLEAVAQPFAGLARDALAELDPGGGPPAAGNGFEARLDAEGIKRLAGLKAPSATTPLRFSARIRTEARARFGFYTVVQWARRALNRQPPGPEQRGLQALTDALPRIKRETIKAVEFHFKSHRENIKFQYLFKLLDAAAASIQEAIHDRLRAYGEDLSQMAGRVEFQGSGRQQTAARLSVLETEAEALGRTLAALHQALCAPRAQAPEGCPPTPPE
jgi:hypothetical protein